jgi:hypothetical protein
VGTSLQIFTNEEKEEESELLQKDQVGLRFELKTAPFTSVSQSEQYKLFIIS